MFALPRRRARLAQAASIAALALLAVLCSSESSARAQGTTALISADSSGTLGNGYSTSPSVSGNGRFVAFSSLSTNLVANDTNGWADVFVRDRVTGQTTLISRDANGVQGDLISWFPTISGNGNVVAFGSFSTNLVPNDTNGFIDAFVKDLTTGQITRVSVSSTGVEANHSVTTVALSFDGRFVVFDDDATNLVANDTNGVADVFFHDRQTGQTTRISVDASGAQANFMSRSPTISYDGRFVCFSSQASNLVPNDTNIAEDVFVRDMQTGQLTRISVDPLGAQGGSDSNSPAISGNGRWVAFGSDASNLVAGDLNAVRDIFVRDLQLGVTSLASLSSGGAQANSTSDAPSISSDGRTVSFYSIATNLAPGVTAPLLNVYVRDRQLGQTFLASADSSGVVGNDASIFSAISGDGRVVAFESTATNLVAGDTNFTQDIFAHEHSGPSLPGFCFGDGSGTACPCGNNSAVGAGQGCTSSLGTGGVLGGSGFTSITADSVSLAGSQMPNSSVLFFQGTTMLAAGAGLPFGDGLRCAGGQIVRLATKINVGGSSMYPDTGDPAVSVRGNCQPGDFRTYQVWYRNAAPFCTTSTFNLTNGVQITWGT